MDSNWIGRILLIGILCLSGQCKSGSRRKIREYSARIMSRPDDIPTVKCGQDIRLTCIAEGQPVPDVEWWFQSQTPDQSDREMIRNLARDGRIKIKTEEIYVIRSTLIIKDAEEIDEGMYQCRASNSRARRNKNINLYQHWKVEEVPLRKVMCRDATMTHTEVIPASKYNQSVYDEALERAVTSFGATSASLSLEQSTSQGTTSQDPTTLELTEEETTKTNTQSTTTSTTTTSRTTTSSIASSTTKNVQTTRRESNTGEKSKASIESPPKDVEKETSKDNDGGDTLERGRQTGSKETTSQHNTSQDGCRNSGNRPTKQGLIMQLFCIVTPIILISSWR